MLDLEFSQMYCDTYTVSAQVSTNADNWSTSPSLKFSPAFSNLAVEELKCNHM